MWITYAKSHKVASSHYDSNVTILEFQMQYYFQYHREEFDPAATEVIATETYIEKINIF